MSNKHPPNDPPEAKWIEVTPDEALVIREALHMTEERAMFGNKSLADMQNVLDELDHAFPDQIGMFERPVLDSEGFDPRDPDGKPVVIILHKPDMKLARS